MRKLLVISLLMAAILSLATVEGTMAVNYFNEIADRLDAVSVMLENGNYDEAKNELSDTRTSWENDRTMIYLISNHTVIRTFYERVVTADVYVESGDTADAVSNLTAAAYLARELAEDLKIDIHNIF